MWFQKQKIRCEKTERLILPNVIRRICEKCSTEQIFVSTEQATYLTQMTSRQIFNLVETGAVHFFETEEGFLFICQSSLKKPSSQKFILTDLERIEEQ